MTCEASTYSVSPGCVIFLLSVFSSAIWALHEGTWVCTYVYVWVCALVCEWVREREREMTSALTEKTLDGKGENSLKRMFLVMEFLACSCLRLQPERVICLSVFISLSVYLFIYLSVYLSSCLSVRYLPSPKKTVQNFAFGNQHFLQDHSLFFPAFW